MALLNHAKKELNAKIVYYGPGLSGKTTNLEWIHKKMEPEKRGKLISLETKTERTLFFDFLPVQIGEIDGYRMRFNVYTVPGQIFYNETRRMVLKGVDGVVFVADCQKEMASENVESLKNLGENLASIGKDMSQIPLVIQYNKMDLPNTLTVEEMNRLLNADGHPFFEAIALQGEGVLTTLARITRMVAEHLKTDLFQQKPVESPPPPPEPVSVSGAPDPEPETDQAPAFLSEDSSPGASMDVHGAAAVALQPEVEEEKRLFDPEPLLLSDMEPLNIPSMGGEESLGEPSISPTAGDQVGAVSDTRSQGGEEPQRWVDPSVIRFPKESTPLQSPPSPSGSFTVRLESPQGQQGQEIQLPVRIRRDDTGEEICIRLRIQVDMCDPEG
jgi:small GTP-binding protein